MCQDVISQLNSFDSFYLEITLPSSSCSCAFVPTCRQGREPTDLVSCRLNMLSALGSDPEKHAALTPEAQAKTGLFPNQSRLACLFLISFFFSLPLASLTLHSKIQTWFFLFNFRNSALLKTQEFKGNIPCPVLGTRYPLNITAACQGSSYLKLLPLGVQP